MPLAHLKRRFPWLAPLWKVLEVVDTVRGYWDWLPGVVRALIGWGLFTLVPGSPIALGLALYGFFDRELQPIVGVALIVGGVITAIIIIIRARGRPQIIKRGGLSMQAVGTVTSPPLEKTSADRTTLRLHRGVMRNQFLNLGGNKIPLAIRVDGDLVRGDELPMVVGIRTGSFTIEKFQQGGFIYAYKADGETTIQIEAVYD